MRRIMIVAGRQRKDYSRSSIRGNHMNLGKCPIRRGTFQWLVVRFF